MLLEFGPPVYTILLHPQLKAGRLHLRGNPHTSHNCKHQKSRSHAQVKRFKQESAREQTNTSALSPHTLRRDCSIHRLSSSQIGLCIFSFYFHVESQCSGMSCSIPKALYDAIPLGGTSFLLIHSTFSRVGHFLTGV